MQLTAFQVLKFRNVVDSGLISVHPHSTCLVGKNEAGKSGMLEALYLFNPAYDEKFAVDEQYPRWLVVKDRKAGSLEDHAPIKVTFQLDPADVTAVETVLGKGVLIDHEITVEKTYAGTNAWSISWSEAAASKDLVTVFPPAVQQVFKNSETLEEIRAWLVGAVSVPEGVSPDDVAAAQSALRDRGLDKTTVWDRLTSILEARLPTFFRFTNYSTLPGRINFREIQSAQREGPARSGIQTARALLALAGTDLNQIGNDDYELRKGELEAVQIDLTNQVFEYWKQNPHLEVLIDVDKETVSSGSGTTAVSRFLDIRLRDKRTGYSNNFSQRSSGFQWFFSFLAAFSEFEEKNSPVVLLDEPALTLHGKAQADFLRFINERLAASAPVLYTTHSPFMVAADKLERVRIIEDNGPPHGAVASTDILAADPDSLFPLQAALGYDIAQNMFVGPHNLVVEGTSDFIYLTIMSQVCGGAGKDTLDTRWRLLPAGGAANIPTFVSLVGPHLDVTVLADSDAKGMQRITNMIEKKLLSQHRLIFPSIATGGGHADIEDLFTEGDYLKLYNRAYSGSLKVSDLPKGDRIVKRIEAAIGQAFVHGEVAETLLRHHHEFSFTDTTLERFSTLLRALNETMG